MTAVTALAALVMLAASEQPPDTCDAKVESKIDAYKECVILAARRLERSGESASDIATASLAACDTGREAFRVAVSPCLPADMSDRLEEHLNEAARKAAVEVIVEIRAARNSK